MVGGRDGERDEGVVVAVVPRLVFSKVDEEARVVNRRGSERTLAGGRATKVDGTDVSAVVEHADTEIPFPITVIFAEAPPPLIVFVELTFLLLPLGFAAAAVDAEELVFTDDILASLGNEDVATIVDVIGECRLAAAATVELMGR